MGSLQEPEGFPDPQLSRVRVLVRRDRAVGNEFEAQLWVCCCDERIGGLALDSDVVSARPALNDGNFC